MEVWSLASFSGLRIQNCLNLRHRSQLQLRPWVAVHADSYSSNLTPSQGTPMCCRCSSKREIHTHTHTHTHAHTHTHIYIYIYSWTDYILIQGHCCYRQITYRWQREFHAFKGNMRSDYRVDLWKALSGDHIKVLYWNTFSSCAIFTILREFISGLSSLLIVIVILTVRILGLDSSLKLAVGTQ